jgi:glycolate oxidase FAD binding subunit
VTAVHDRQPLAARDPWSPDSVSGIQDVVRSATAMRTPLRIVGRGTWLDAGHPASPDARPLQLRALDGVTQYTPGDLTLTARAGTALATIDALTATEGQWLPLDPFSRADHGGTIGATIATASSGPLAHALGLPRDVILGVEVVTGDGSVIHAGGRVVKNVAGFDLTRLMTGAWGTLGIITEVTVRLRGRPTCDETVVLVRRRSHIGRSQQVGNTAAVEELVCALRGAPVVPLAAELVNRRLAAELRLPSPDDGSLALVRLAGNAERVTAERLALAAIGDVVAVKPDVWDALRHIEPDGSAVLRWSHLPRRISTTWAHAGAACAAFPDALVHASIGRGIVRAIIPHPESAALAEAIAHDAARSGLAIMGLPAADTSHFAGTCVAERLPAWLWGAGGSPALQDPLSRRVRQAFDPAHVLNPGVLGEGLVRA